MDEFIFENANTGKRFKIVAENSDEALILCLRVNGWKENEILYLGRTSFVESADFINQRDELRYIPGSHS